MTLKMNRPPELSLPPGAKAAPVNLESQLKFQAISSAPSTTEEEEPAVAPPPAAQAEDELGSLEAMVNDSAHHHAENTDHALPADDPLLKALENLAKEEDVPASNPAELYRTPPPIDQPSAPISKKKYTHLSCFS